MENKLEQLLNSLVKVGWKPYGISRVKNVTLLNRYVSFSKRTILGIEFFEYSLRELVSKESGLWQFCIENGLVEVDNNIPTLWEKKYKATGVESIYKNDIHFEKECEYRLIESSLKDESELESFILDNIKVDG